MRKKRKEEEDECETNTKRETDRDKRCDLSFLEREWMDEMMFHFSGITAFSLLHELSDSSFSSLVSQAASPFVLSTQ